MPNLGAPELLVLLLIIIILFGAKRLPDTARSLGKSLRILKDEAKSDGRKPDTANNEKGTDSDESASQ